MKTTLEILDLELTQQKLKLFGTLISSCQKHFIQFLRQVLDITATGPLMKMSTVVPHTSFIVSFIYRGTCSQCDGFLLKFHVRCIFV